MTTIPVLKEKLKTVDQLIEYKLNSNDMHQKQIDSNNKELKELLTKRAELASQIRSAARKGK
jgi:chorismate mutase